MDVSDGPATFVVPHWTADWGRSGRHLDAAIESMLQQHDRAFRIVLVDDASPDPRARAHLERIQRQHSAQVHVIWKPVNDGAGVARNLGIQWADAQGSPFVLFNDADDVSDPRRLALVRRAFVAQPTAAVVYSTFGVIDQDGQVVPPAEMTPSVAEVLEAHRRYPPQGENAWIGIGTETGYINHTSSTAVRTDVALRFPFPPERVSEDSHTWLRYSAGGGPFVYLDEPLSAYRTTRDTAGSASRSREGGKRGFYATKARVDAAGFREAVELAVARNTIRSDQTDELLVRFFVRLSQTLAREGEIQLAAEQVRLARLVSSPLTAQVIAEHGYAGHDWTVSTGEDVSRPDSREVD